MSNSAWTNHCKKFAFENKINYIDALKSEDCQQLYQKKEKKPIKIKKLRKEQNDLVMEYLNNHYTLKQFREKYIDIEDKINKKSSQLKIYRDYYKMRNKKKA